eukprot:365661-Chlamydomonas_euryale.AAC.88
MRAATRRPRLLCLHGGCIHCRPRHGQAPPCRRAGDGWMRGFRTLSWPGTAMPRGEGRLDARLRDPAGAGWREAMLRRSLLAWMCRHGRGV